MKSEGLIFEDLVGEILNRTNFREIHKGFKTDKFQFDFVAYMDHEGSELLYAIEAKFYKSKIIPFTTTLTACYQFADQIQQSDQGFTGGVFISSSYITKNVKKEIFDKTGISVWDRSTLYNFVSKNIELTEKLDELFLESNQIIDELPFNRGESEIEKNIELSDVVKQGELKGKKPSNRGAELSADLIEIKEGVEWRKFEVKCIEALKYMFEDDLSLWEEQNTTEDDLSRYDLICRISSKNDYWTSLSRYFNTRYVLFEFKNYTNPIKQGEIYTTEKYLFTKALRSIGYIIARNGAESNALKAAKGALREHGKLLQIIDLNEIREMLKMKDENSDPNDFLADKLDKLLIELGR